ncbi:MAG: uroporphyrinogen decarboxylase family protein [Eubacteriaceae bacterium]
MEKLSQERNQLFVDLDEGKIPKRVPNATLLDSAYCIQYAGADLKKTQWNIEELINVLDLAAKDFKSDISPGVVTRLANIYKILEAKNFVMGSDGFIQHPEVVGMLPEDYNEFIKDPLKCIHDTIFPRVYTNLDVDAVMKSRAYAKAQKAYFDSMIQLGMGTAKTNAKYGLTDGMIASMCEAPFDLIADQFRSFSGISMDIRRRPQQVLDACEAVTPMMIKCGATPRNSVRNKAFIPLHMAPYMREKDFKKFYWPSFKKLVEGLWEAGTGVFLFVEHDWTRFIDYLQELPKGTLMMFEYGDPKTIKNKLGSKHILSGFYPINMLATGTKQQCIDKAKELIDILAPGGNYIFGTDKVPLVLADAKPENIIAVNEFVREYAVY